MKDNMKATQERMRKYYNRKRGNEVGKFKVSDWVMVNLKNIKTKGRTKKLDFKLCGKFQVAKLIGTCVYRLKLPPMACKIHPVFHISLLGPYHANTITGRRSPTPPPMDLEEQEWYVERIVTSQIRK